MRPVLADTFYWIALTNPDDSAHQRVASYDASPTQPPIISTEEILIEFLTFFSGKGSVLRLRAVAVARSLASNHKVRILPQSHDTYLTGLAHYASRPDKDYSLTDCISMQTMKREGLSEVLTNDRHFEQEGFKALFRS